MSVIAIAVTLGLLLAAVGICLKRFAGWRRTHHAIIGGLTMIYGMWLALGTGSVLKLVVPSLASIGVGSTVGLAIGWLTYLAVGVVGVLTGGMGVAIGKVGMMLIGAALAGAGTGGLPLVRTPLISPWFWGPTLLLGLYLLTGAYRHKESVRLTSPLAPPLARCLKCGPPRPLCSAGVLAYLSEGEPRLCQQMAPAHTFASNPPSTRTTDPVT